MTRRALSTAVPLRGALAILASLGAVFVVPVHAIQIDQLPDRLWEAEDNDEAVEAVARLFQEFYRNPQNTRYRLPGRWTVCDQDVGGCRRFDTEAQCMLVRCQTPEQVRKLVEGLAALARRHPESPTAGGQAIYTATRFGFPDLAMELAASCEPGNRWWCHLATGYVLQRTGHSPEAERRLQRGLEVAPDWVAFYLEDLMFLLPEAERSKYRAMTPREREKYHKEFWWLSDPLYTDDTNDRWVEHVARGLELLSRESMNLKELVTGFSEPEEGRIRRGITDSWRPDRDPRARGTGIKRWTSRTGAFNHFVPDGISLVGFEPGLTFRTVGTMEDEGYTRSSGPMLQLPSQVVRFREGDSLLVAIASDLEQAGVPRSLPWAEQGVGGDLASGQAFFVASEDPEHVTTLDLAPLREKVIFKARVVNRNMLVGLEVFTSGLDGRHRQVLQPLDTSERLVSDILLFRPLGANLPETRLGAVALMYGSQRVSNDRELGVYWEAYGFSVGEELRVSTRLESVEGGWVSRALRVIGVGGEGRSPVSWTETVNEPGPFPKVITLHIGDLAPGFYDLVIEVVADGGTRLSQRRRFEVFEASHPAKAFYSTRFLLSGLRGPSLLSGPAGTAFG